MKPITIVLIFKWNCIFNQKSSLMEIPKDYLDINKKTWNSKTDVHIASEFYDTESFINGKNTLNEIELALLGDVSGKKILHLQCHLRQLYRFLSRLRLSQQQTIRKTHPARQRQRLPLQFVRLPILRPEHHRSWRRRLSRWRGIRRGCDGRRR